MPGDLVARCAECGVSTPVRDLKRIGGVWVLDHKTDCSQVWMARPFIFTTYQAINPSRIAEDFDDEYREFNVS